VQDQPAKFSRPEVLSIREQKAIDTLINIGLLIEKRLDSQNLSLKFYDTKGELLLIKKMTSWKALQYEVYKVGKSEFTDDLNYDQVPKLFVATTTDLRINIEHYIPGAWETRLAKLAEGKHNGESERIPKIQRSPRTPKRQSPR